MEKTRISILVFVLLAFAFSGFTLGDKAPSVYEFQMKDIDGNPVSLSQFKGKVAMIVNVASKCGFTPQYEGLQKIYEKYSGKGFVVLGFPSNSFRNQEPGTNAEIKEFCSSRFGVTFPMFEKISVLGDDIHPLYKFLTEETSNPQFFGDIQWNFTKFLIGRDGAILARFQTPEKPESEKVIGAIEKALLKE
jgi:glutathione peroxidase